MKSGFLTELDARLKGDRIWVLDAPLLYVSNILQTTVHIPIGFNTDLASVPRVPLIYEMWGNRAHREAVLHDYLFCSDSDPDVSFAQANSMFLEAMASRGVAAHIRYPMYWAVCMCGLPRFHRRSINAEVV
jgi:hypothetical protein